LSSWLGLAKEIISVLNQGHADKARQNHVHIGGIVDAEWIGWWVALMIIVETWLHESSTLSFFPYHRCENKVENLLGVWTLYISL